MDARHEELAAQATRVQECGPITDYFGCGPTLRERYGDTMDPLDNPDARLALCRCVHGNEWPEGGRGSEGVCRECVREAFATLAV